MKAEEFQESAPGRLIPTIGGAQAFVPEPPPESLPIEPSTIALHGRAEHALGRLAGTTARELNPYLVGSPLLHREAILSSRMEGTITTPEQLVLVQAVPNADSAHDDAEAREVLNYIEAMNHGLRRLDALPVCLRMIREIHGVLMAGVRGGRERPGEFRTDQNWIRGRLDDSIANARFVPPPVAEMSTALSDFEAYLNVDPSSVPLPDLIRLAVVHYQFETIHPFRDGNGRVGRLILPLLLCSLGRLESPILFLSAFFEKHRDTYVDLLLHVSQTGDWKSWIDFFLRGLIESAEEGTRQANDLLALRQTYHRHFQKGRSSALLMRLVDRLFQTPSITIGAAAEVLEVSNQAASNNIKKLIAAGILEETTGRRKGQVFIAREILRFMQDQPSDAS